MLGGKKVGQWEKTRLLCLRWLVGPFLIGKVSSLLETKGFFETWHLDDGQSARREQQVYKACSRRPVWHPRGDRPLSLRTWWQRARLKQPRLRGLADASFHDLHSSMDCLNTFIYLQVRGSTCHGMNIRSEDSFWELHFSGLTANVFTDWAISPTQNHGCSWEIIKGLKQDRVWIYGTLKKILYLIMCLCTWVPVPTEARGIRSPGARITVVSRPK